MTDSEPESLSVREAANRYSQSKRAPSTAQDGPDQVSEPGTLREVLGWIDEELSRSFPRPTNGHDILDMRERLQRAKALGSLRDELLSGEATVV